MLERKERKHIRSDKNGVEKKMTEKDRFKRGLCGEGGSGGKSDQSGGGGQREGEMKCGRRRWMKIKGGERGWRSYKEKSSNGNG